MTYFLINAIYLLSNTEHKEERKKGHSSHTSLVNAYSFKKESVILYYPTEVPHLLCICATLFWYMNFHQAKQVLKMLKLIKLQPKPKILSEQYI